MIHAYNEDILPIVQRKLASMFEIAVVIKNINIDNFAQGFVSSPVCRAFESADPVFVLGRSATELLSTVLGDAPCKDETSSYASPQYWVGHTLAYMQWYFKKPYADLISAFPCGQLLLEYFPYHEMDISKCVELFASKLHLESTLKRLRSAKGLSQNDLAIMSGVSIRSIRAYEQGAADISKAQADTLYAISKVLDCSIEDLIT